MEDGTPIRLYPVQLRYLPSHRQYSLYDWVKLPLKPSQEDPRPESYRTVDSKIQVVGNFPPDPGWMKRRQVIFADTSWHYDCLEELKADRQEAGVSLGFIEVGEVLRVWIRERPEEQHQKHLQKLEELQGQGDLFGLDQKDLEFQRFRVYVEWRCRDLDSCPGHRAGILDWGLGELGRREGPEVALQKIESIADPVKYELGFFMGNFKAYPHNFGVVGLWYPRRHEVIQRSAPLFS